MRTGYMGAFWGLCARPALGALSLLRKQRERAFPSRPPRRKGRRERPAEPSASRPLPRELRPQRSLPSTLPLSCCPRSARPKHFQPPDSCRSLRSALLGRCPEWKPPARPSP